MDFRSKSILIVGEGVSGMSALYTLQKQGANCIIYDGRQAFPEDIDYDYAVVSPGVPTDNAVFEFAAKRKIKLIGELELGWLLNNDKPLIAVTGTNGKTTVTQLIGDILSREHKVAVCGNIGIPFSSVAAAGDYDVAVVETSSFQLETTDGFRPRIACITNIDCDHLDRHKTMENYAKLKLRIAESQTSDDVLVLSQDGIDAKYLEGFCPKSRVYYTALDKKVDGAYRLDDKLMFMNEVICKRSELPLAGDFNVCNALAAICVCRLYGVNGGVIRDVLHGFRTAAHRLQRVARVGDKDYWDDSKGTNIAASVQACKAMDGDTLVIMGGSDKGYEYTAFFENMPHTVKEIALIGETAKKIELAAFAAGFTKVTLFDTLEAAVCYASKRNVQNVLLSPASASFDMFRNYASRGDAFIEAVRRLDK